MKRILYPAGVLFIGLAASHGLFTVLVYLSDLALFERAQALISAGYLVIPHEPVLSSLIRIWPAFCGALFFTLTTGAGLSLLAFAAAWAHRRIFGDRKWFLLLIVGMWAAMIVAVNADGWNVSVTAAFLVIPAIVFTLSLRWMPMAPHRGENLARTVHVIAILVVAIAWMPKLDGNVFINIRDYLLLENPAGKAVNQFYYRYTLYPAEVFKRLDQKLQKTVHITGVSDTDTSKKLVVHLMKRDYLPVDADSPADLKVHIDGTYLLFSDAERVLAQTDLAAFSSDPEAVLKDVSSKSDNNRFFRLFTFISLVTAFPLALYVFAHAIFGTFFGIFSRRVPLRSILASLACLAIGIGAALPLYAEPSRLMTSAEIRQSLEASDWKKVRAALKTISGQGIDPLRYAEWDPKWMRSPHVPVRYWLAQSLGNSRQPAAFRMLLELASDPHPNVACMAYYGLGRSGKKKAVEAILSRMPNIRHWYVQWYAYKSLRRLGWQQKRSDTVSTR